VPAHEAIPVRGGFPELARIGAGGPFAAGRGLERRSRRRLESVAQRDFVFVDEVAGRREL
jgi:hypothetical protein